MSLGIRVGAIVYCLSLSFAGFCADDSVEGGSVSKNHWLHKGELGVDSLGPVTQEMLEQGTSDPEKWLLYGGSYANHRHSPMKDFTTRNVKKLRVSWAMPTGTTGQFEASPVVYDGIMYVTTSYNRLFALNATNGDIYWRYDHSQPKDPRFCCGPVNRGVAISGDTLLMGTLDAKLLAFNRHTGEIIWETEVGNYKHGLSITAAPLIVGNLAVIGVAGGEFGIRGYFDAYNLNTGERVWRHYTVPAEGEPGAETWADDSYKTGGSPAWTTGAYDPETETLFWTTGNPAPDWNGDSRKGDNLYSDSVLAVDIHTGVRKWHFQYTPHDVWDYDGNSQIFLLDMKYKGEKRKTVVQANRNGYYYIIDRTNGEFLQATKYLEQVTWGTIDENGRPVVNPLAMPKEDPDFRVCPGLFGGSNGAWTNAYSPKTGYIYVAAMENCMQFEKGFSMFLQGLPFLGGSFKLVDAKAGKSYGHLTAIDAATGDIAWRYHDDDPMMGGVLSTEGGVVFTGNQQGKVLALDAKKGKVLWEFKMGSGIRSQPIVYKVDGRAYLAVGSGNYINFASSSGGPSIIPEGGHLFVFSLDGR